VIGTTATTTPTPHPILLLFRAASATTGGELPALNEGESFHMIHCRDNGELLIATTNGRIFVRDLAKTWHLRHLDTTPPVETMVTQPASRPAQTR